MHGRVMTAAMSWWESKQPLSYSLEEHLKDPSINCTTEEETELANAIGEYLVVSRDFIKKISA